MVGLGEVMKPLGVLMWPEPVPLPAASVSSGGSVLLTGHLRTGPDVRRGEEEEGRSSTVGGSRFQKCRVLLKRRDFYPTQGLAKKPLQVQAPTCLTSRHPSFPSASPRLLPQTLTLLPHARLAAFAKPTLLALATHVGVHGAVATTVANIACSLDDTAAEESLAALTAQHVVVEA